MQKQKNIKALHDGFKMIYPDTELLEISSKSTVEAGCRLSAFNLQKYVPELGRSIPVENVYQSGKVFENGGPFTDMWNCTPKEARRDERLRNSGRLLKFTFDGVDFPLVPESLFYDYIYLSAVRENSDLAEEIAKYSGFTDIEFNPNKSISTQAKSAAVYVSLARSGLLDCIDDPEKFWKIFMK